MPSASKLLAVLGIAVTSCAAGVRPVAERAPAPPVTEPRPTLWSGCGSPGRERCGPEPAQQAVVNALQLGCAERCSKDGMESSGVVAASEDTADSRRAQLGKVEATLLRCFALCEKAGTELSSSNLPAGVQPCWAGGHGPEDTECLEYSCQLYGEKEYMLPSAIRTGQACEVPSTKQPGTCFAGSCVPAAAHSIACSAVAMRETALQWANVRSEQQYCQPTPTDSCATASYAFSNRSTLLLYLMSCETLPGEWGPPAVPWGHWPITLAPEAK